MSAKNGGPAFPNAHYNRTGGYDISGGMTLRDYFAAKVMGGMCTITGTDFGGVNEAARIAYKIADAMLAAREAK